MRIVVISDSHRRSDVIEKILNAQKTAKHVFFLGDNTADIEDFEYLYPDKSFHTVCGNCDFNSLLPTVGLEVIEGKRIFYTHGHTYNVKYGLQRLIETAKQNKYDIVLYGHTHIASTLYEEGIYFVNPGSCSSPRSSKASYCVIDITENGIMPVIIEL